MSDDNHERRRFSRMPVSVMIRVKSEEDAEAFVTNYTRDLSLGGMFLKSLTPKPVGTQVFLQLPSPNPPGYTEVTGKVVFQNTTTSEGLLTGMGIEFVSLGDGARSVLQRFIEGTWQELFHVENEPTEEAVIGVIEALLGLISMLIRFVHKTRA